MKICFDIEASLLQTIQIVMVQVIGVDNMQNLAHIGTLP